MGENETKLKNMIVLWYMSDSSKDNGMQIPIDMDQKNKWGNIFFKRKPMLWSF